MGAYFEFLRANGQSLDPKTRALISVITKVANETESGLKQYARKALEQGVSPDEILDALMMAFPALGLSKIIWAVDILLDIDALPRLDVDSAPRAGSDDTAWHLLGETNDFVGDVVRTVSVDGRSVFVSKLASEFRVFEAKCTHHETSLAFVETSGGEVECPLHGWRFRVADGTCVRGGRDLFEFENKIDDGRLLARW